MENLQIPFMVITLTGYLVAFIVNLIDLFIPRSFNKKISKILVWFSFAINTFTLVLRGFLIRSLPLSSTFEFGLFFVWAIILVLIIIENKFKITSLSLFTLPMAVIILFWLINTDNTIRPLMPALRSNWLLIHVLTAVISYGAFAISFALALMYLVKENLLVRNSKNRFTEILPSLEILDDLIYKIIFIGLPFLTIMIVTGAVWAEYAWGSYWSWDPKETWALITWFIYSGYLHVRLMRGWKGKKAVLLAVLGFLAVLFTFFGVTYLLPGMHSY